MAWFSVCVPHEMGREAAMARMQPFLDDMRKYYAQEVSDVRLHWNDNRLEFCFITRGMRMEGALAVEDGAVNVSGPLPLAILPYRNRIEHAIQEKLEKLLR